jgi:hypothetical protein
MPRRTVLALIAGAGVLAVAAGLPLAATAPGPAIFLGSHTWQMEDPNFGGLSGLEIAADGSAFLALTDRGSTVSGRLLRGSGGAVAGVEAEVLTAVRGLKGEPVTRRLADPEGLAMAPDGRFFVSFEGIHRVWAYAAPGAVAETLPQHPDFARLQRNSGLEALAIDAEGRLYAVPERSGRLDRPFPVYRLSSDGWDIPFRLPRDGGYLPVGADFGPDGQLYLLERNFRGPLGFFARISRFDLTGDRPGPRQILMESRAPFQNNFEGIAVWRDATGDIRITLISDDNFTGFLSTEFADYRLGG